MQQTTRSSQALHSTDDADADRQSITAYKSLQRSGWPNWVPLNTDLPVESRIAGGSEIPSRPRGKYLPLYNYLAAIALSEITVRLADFPEHVGLALPPTAFKHQAFWSNQRSIAVRPWAAAWHAAGFRVDKIDLAGSEAWVRFRRRS
jgi:hypothetical protein